MKKIIYIIVGLIIGIVFFGYSTIKNMYQPLKVYNDFKDETNTQKSKPGLATTSVNTKNSTNEPTSVANQYKYTSYKLGVSFKYLAKSETYNVAVKEEGDKIYVYDPSWDYVDYTKGQYIQVFTKNSNSTLKEEIENKFLKGYSKNDCIYTKETTTINKINPNFEIGNIKVANKANDMEQFFKDLEKCPKPFTMSNGISYFIYDTKHQNKFAFISIGQYGLPADSKNSWQDTLEFID